MTDQLHAPGPTELHLGGNRGPKIQTVEPRLPFGPPVIESHTYLFPDQPSSPYTLQTQIRKPPQTPFYALLMRLTGRHDYVTPALLDIGARPSEPTDNTYDYWKDLSHNEKHTLAKAVHHRTFCHIDAQKGMTIAFQNEPVYALPHPPNQEPIHEKGEPLLLGKFAWRPSPGAKQYDIYVYARVDADDFPTLAKSIAAIIGPDGTLDESELRTLVDLRFDISPHGAPPPRRYSPIPEPPSPEGEAEKVLIPVTRADNASPRPIRMSIKE